MKLFKNGIIYTGDQITDHFVVDGKYFGQEADQYDEVIDLKGKFVVPGFIDSHMHLLNFGQALLEVQLQDHTSSLQEMKQAVKDYIIQNKVEKGKWVKGRGWNHDYFSDENRFPDRYDLDEISMDHPIMVTRCCGHISVVNSKALELIKMPENYYLEDGQIDLDEKGKPTGVFRENAITLIEQAIPPVTKEEIKEMILTASHELNHYGITSCHSDDFKVFPVDYKIVLAAFEELRNQLTVRVNEQSQLTKEELKEFLANGYTTNVGDEIFKIGPLKMLGDGSLGAGTAYLKEPYEDAPAIRGIPIFTLEQFKEMIELAHSHHMAVAIHSIGDQTFENILTAYEYVINKYPDIQLRHGIIHCQITSNEQIKKFARLGLHAYIQSIFLDYDIHIVHKRVGKRADESYGFTSYLKEGSHVSNGSDCPVELPDVLKGMQCAITRKTVCDHMGPYRIEEACDLSQAIASFTSEGAYASYEEKIKGKIQKGMLADFVVLDKDLFKVVPDELSSVKILETYFNGEKVY